MFVMLNITSIATVLFLVLLEGLLSLDNALVLALLVKDLPALKRKQALTYGIWGAFGFRALALLCIRGLLGVTWVKLVGGLYLVWVFSKWMCDQIWGEPKKGGAPVFISPFKFWRVILTVELMDIAFSVDSILASIAVSDQFWVIFIGGCLGICMMRVAANSFVWLVKKFPSIEKVAYWIVFGLGVKLLAQWTFWALSSTKG